MTGTVEINKSGSHGFARRAAKNRIFMRILMNIGIVSGLGCLSVFTASAQSSDETIDLAENDALRLGIRFKPVAQVDDLAGAQVPAQIIPSLDERSAHYSTVDGLLSEWVVTTGERVAAGALLARVASNVASELQNHWLDAGTELNIAHIEAARSRKLFGLGVVAQRRLQQAELVLERAVSNEESAKRALKRIGFDDKSIEALAETNENMGYALLRSERTGVLVHQAVNIGEPVKVGDTLAEFQSDSLKWLSFTLPTKLAAGLADDSKLSVLGTNETLTLRRRDYVIDTLTQTVEAYAEFDLAVDYPFGSIIDVLIAPPAGGVLVPASAVVYHEGRNYVYVKTSDGVLPRAIDLSPIGRDYTASEGIRIGEVIAISGTALLKGMQLGLGGDS